METTINELSEYRRYAIGYFMCTTWENILKSVLSLENKFQKFKINRENLRKIIKDSQKFSNETNSYWLEYLDNELGVKSFASFKNYKTNESRFLDFFKYKFEEWRREQ